MSEARTNPRRAAPPLLAALALWGWQAELLPWALGMGLLVEAARFSRFRFDILQSDFKRLWNFTALLFVGVGLYVFLARDGLETVGAMANVRSPAGQLDGVRQITRTVVAFQLWLPFVFFPFTLVHAWSRRATLPWTTFSLLGRTQAVELSETEASPRPGSRVHPAYPFFAIVLFASCAAAAHPLAFLPLLVGVIAWALWPWRNRRFGAPVWVGLVMALLVSTLAAQQGLMAMQEAWQAIETRWMRRMGEGRLDQLHGVTALGSVGRLKQSGRIVLRAQTQNGNAPGLLREAAFNRFRGNVWSSGHRNFQPASTAGDGSLWRLANGRRGGRLMRVARFTSRGESALALPGDTQTLRDLPAVVVETNYMAAARLRDGPPLAIYWVEHGEGGGFDGPPEPDDTDLDHLDEPDREAIRRVAGQLGLSSQSGEVAVETVRRHFARGFDYSLWQQDLKGATNKSPLEVFLQDSHAGHCEYFATATVLLLRAAGVPTRYAVGYSLESRRGDWWLGRGRDAHAWCLAFVNGLWRVVDTTPGTWRARETAAASGWIETITDWFSQLRYQFALWRQEGGNWRIIVFSAGMSILAWLAWRQLRGSRWRRMKKGPAVLAPGMPVPGVDSEFFDVARRLETACGERMSHETMSAWICRLQLDASLIGDPLREAVALHYRLRFDPRGLPEGERDRLRQLARILAPMIRTTRLRTKA